MANVTDLLDLVDSAAPHDGAFRLDPLPAMPLDLWSHIHTAVNRAVTANGYEAFYQKATGLGVIYVKRTDGETPA